jgi:hypothetical protein
VRIRGYPWVFAPLRGSQNGLFEPKLARFTVSFCARTLGEWGATGRERPLTPGRGHELTQTDGAGPLATLVDGYELAFAATVGIPRLVTLRLTGPAHGSPARQSG